MPGLEQVRELVDEHKADDPAGSVAQALAAARWCRRPVCTTPSAWSWRGPSARWWAGAALQVAAGELDAAAPQGVVPGARGDRRWASLRSSRRTISSTQRFSSDSLIHPGMKTIASPSRRALTIRRRRSLRRTSTTAGLTTGSDYPGARRAAEVLEGGCPQVGTRPCGTPAPDCRWDQARSRHDPNSPHPTGGTPVHHASQWQRSGGYAGRSQTRAADTVQGAERAEPLEPGEPPQHAEPGASRRLGPGARPAGVRPGRRGRPAPHAPAATPPGIAAPGRSSRLFGLDPGTALVVDDLSPPLAQMLDELVAPVDRDGLIARAVRRGAESPRTTCCAGSSRLVRSSTRRSASGRHADERRRWSWCQAPGRSPSAWRPAWPWRVSAPSTRLRPPLRPRPRSGRPRPPPGLPARRPAPRSARATWAPAWWTATAGARAPTLSWTSCGGSCRVPAPGPLRGVPLPDLCVLADAAAPDPVQIAELHRTRVAHLPVRLRDGTGVVGPCSCCRDDRPVSAASELHRRARDPGWPAVAASSWAVREAVNRRRQPRPRRWASRRSWRWWTAGRAARHRARRPEHDRRRPTRPGRDAGARPRGGHAAAAPVDGPPGLHVWCATRRNERSARRRETIKE